ncbi:alpha/beta fold hydrolase [Cellulomonas xylanilytica]|uniref:Hydrolase n=1 Tax=Cellulomonas xylanilytica TaxID=233583 RepID=A0A510V6Q3_9CELL|nr:alpha/beta hydrolase [Cellulomonas xylanilytica]GEK22476.1 hydrolase [Cellulomonas xylanilytica]
MDRHLPEPSPSPSPSAAFGGAARHVDLDGRVQYRDLGGPSGAPVLLCLHGLGGSALNWAVLAPGLVATHRVLALDLLGHGGSGPGPVGGADQAVAAQLRVIERFADEVVGAPVTLVGHSIGGIMAVLHAEATPRQVDRLVLLSPPVPRRTRWSVDLRLAGKLALLRAPGTAAVVRHLAARRTPAELVQEQLTRATPHVRRIPARAVDASIVEAARRAALPDAGRAAAAQWDQTLAVVSLLMHAGRWRSTIAAVPAPALWLHGTDDPLAAVEPARALAASRPDWDFAALPGVGHLPHLEDPGAVAERMLQWLTPRRPHPSPGTDQRHRTPLR